VWRLDADADEFIAFAEETKFSHDRGFYDAPFVLNITTATPGATIRFSTNGIPASETNGVVYLGPITIDHTMVLRAAAFKPGYQPSKMDTRTYIFLDDVIRQAAEDLDEAGLRAVGYVTVEIDDGWQGTRDAAGALYNEARQADGKWVHRNYLAK
jgi:hypothetical protein